MAKRDNIGFAAFISLVSVMPLAYADCPKDNLVKVRLTASEFEIPGYDADRGLLAVRPSQELLPTKQRKRSVKLLLRAQDILLPVGPASLRLGLERTSLLELHLEGEPAKPVTRLGMKPDCDRLVVRTASLRHDGMVLAKRDLRPPRSLRPNVSATIQIERGHADKRRLVRLTRLLATRCLARPALREQRVRGALSIQLERPLVGEPAQPKVVVDGLVNPAVLSCLTLSLQESDAVWGVTDPGTRLYVNYFFRISKSVTPPR